MKLFAAAALLAGLAATTNAATIRFWGDPSNGPALPTEIPGTQFRLGNGGEFKVETRSGWVGLTGLPGDLIGRHNLDTDGNASTVGRTFQTFCLEVDENIAFGGNNIYNAQINNSGPTGSQALAGGANTNSGDPLDPKTAFLYTRFRMGTLPHYAYTGNAGGLLGGLTRDHTARALQLAIWRLENEITQITAGTNTNDAKQAGSQAVADLANFYIQLANNSGWTTIGNVRVINVGNAPGFTAQDQLTIIPLPTAGGLASLGLLGVITAGRRRPVRATVIS